MHVDRISEDNRRILKSWQELDKEAQRLILSGVQNGAFPFDVDKIKHSDNTKLSEFYQVAKNSSQSTLNFDLLFSLQHAQKAYERAIDLDVLEIMASQMLDSYDGTTERKLMALRDPQIKNKIIEQSPWLKEDILNAAQSYTANTQVDPVAKVFLFDVLREYEDDFLNRVAEKFRDEHLTCEEMISTEELNVHDVIFLRSPDNKIYLESVIEVFHHEGTMLDPQVSTVNTKGETNLRTLNDFWKNTIVGIGYLPANPSRNKIGLDTVWKNPESDKFDYEGMHHVFCGVEKTGDFRNPDLSHAYALLLRDRLQGSLIAPYEMPVDRTLQQWEDVINLPYSAEENYAIKNVRVIQNSLNKLESNLEHMMYNAFPISVSGVEDVLSATRSVHDKIEKLSWQKNVCFSEPENDDKINKTSPSSFMDNS